MRQGANLPRYSGAVKDNAATPGEQRPLKAGAVARRSCTGHRASTTPSPWCSHPVLPRSHRGGRRVYPLRCTEASLPWPPAALVAARHARGQAPTGPWRSLVARLHGMQKVAGSNPAGSTRSALRRRVLLGTAAAGTAASPGLPESGLLPG